MTCSSIVASHWHIGTDGDFPQNNTDFPPLVLLHYFIQTLFPLQSQELNITGRLSNCKTGGLVYQESLANPCEMIEEGGQVSSLHLEAFGGSWCLSQCKCIGAVW